MPALTPETSPRFGLPAKLLIYGSKSFASTAADLAHHCGHEVVGFIDDFAPAAGAVVGGFNTVVDAYSTAEVGIVLAVGYSHLDARWALWNRVKAAGYMLPPLVHPRAYVADNASVGEGCIVMAGAIVDVRASLAEAVVLWPGACINHDSRIGANTFISPNVTVCGDVRIGAHCFIGAGAAIADGREVPDSSFVKMLSLYTGKPNE